MCICSIDLSTDNSRDHFALSKSPFTIGAEALNNPLRSDMNIWLFISYHKHCKSSRICCVRLCGRIVVNMHINQMRFKLLQCNARPLMRTFYNLLVYSQERCMLYKDCKINCNCLCVCCATLRLLLNVIGQRFTFSARFIGFNANALPLLYTIYRLFLLCDIFASITDLARPEFRSTMLW